jgi:hypothetical protein
MGIIRKLLGGSESKIEFKKKFREEEQNRKIERLLNEREMSANERDLLKRIEQKREEGIKLKLDDLRKKDNEEMWKSKHSVIKGNKSILTNDRPILKEKNIFKNNPQLFTKEHTIKHNTNMGFFK